MHKAMPAQERGGRSGDWQVVNRTMEGRLVAAVVRVGVRGGVYGSGGGGWWDFLRKAFVDMLDLLADNVVDDDMRQKNRADLPQGSHVAAVFVAAMGGFVSEGFGQKDAVRMVGRRHQLDVQAVRVKATFLQVFLCRGKVFVAAAGFGYEKADDDFHAAVVLIPSRTPGSLRQFARPVQLLESGPRFPQRILQVLGAENSL